ncbi:hypothetical protein B0H12DRAFT_131964 [Mycena haematopus]|nr:hypothetical protein B0H12DRAFT_131964 [Mycena haematopus]
MMTALQILSPRNGETDAVTYLLGGWDLAICSALFLQGVLCAQFAHYTSSERRESMWLKFFVAGLGLSTTLKSVQSLAIMWIQNVILFGNVEAASSMWATNLVTQSSMMSGAAVTFYVQMFFCHRLWALSRNAFTVIICATLLLFGLISAVIATFSVISHVSAKTICTWVSIHMGFVLCGDLLLTGSTVLYLLRHSNQFVLSRGPTATLISSLLRVTVQSAAPAAVCALINFATVMGQLRGWAPALLMVDFITNLWLPQLYAWSAMWTLNSRDDVLLAARNSPYTVNLGTSVAASDSETPQSLQASKNDMHTQRNSEPLGKAEKLQLVV